MHERLMPWRKSVTWSREAVWAREIEAQDTMLRLPRANLNGIASAWPSIVREFVDAVAAEETREKDGYPWDPSWSKPSPPAARAIDRMQEVWRWHGRYLVNEPLACQVIQGMALAEALHQPLLWGVRRFLRRRRWQAYRLRDKALDAIVGGLRGEHVPYQPLSSEQFGMLTQ